MCGNLKGNMQKKEACPYCDENTAGCHNQAHTRGSLFSLNYDIASNTSLIDSLKYIVWITNPFPDKYVDVLGPNKDSVRWPLLKWGLFNCNRDSLQGSPTQGCTILAPICWNRKIEFVGLWASKSNPPISAPKQSAGILKIRLLHFVCGNRHMHDMGWMWYENNDQ